MKYQEVYLIQYSVLTLTSYEDLFLFGFLKTNFIVSDYVPSNNLWSCFREHNNLPIDGAFLSWTNNLYFSCLTCIALVINSTVCKREICDWAVSCILIDRGFPPLPYIHRTIKSTKYHNLFPEIDTFLRDSVIDQRLN